MSKTYTKSSNIILRNRGGKLMYSLRGIATIKQMNLFHYYVDFPVLAE